MERREAQRANRAWPVVPGRDSYPWRTATMGVVSRQWHNLEDSVPG